MFLQCVWIFVQTEGTKQTIAMKVPPMLSLPWLVSEENVTIEMRILVLPEAQAINY